MRFLFIGVNFCMTACIFSYELGFFIFKKKMKRVMRFLFIGNTSKLSCLKILNSCNARILLLKDILANLTIGLQQNLEITYSVTIRALLLCHCH